MENIITKSKNICELAGELNKKVIYLNGKGALHHCSPSAGGWGISRVACLVPEIEIIFVIPMGCGRHGSIAAFANGTINRITYVLVEEVDLVSGDHLRYVEEAIETIINERSPKGVIVFSTCMDDLLGSDYESIERYLENKYNLPIRHGKMNPILSESKKAPAVMIQKTIYEFWSEVENRENAINVLGPFAAFHESCEIVELMNKSGFKISHVSQSDSFDEYMSMEYARLNMIVSPRASIAAKHLKKKNNQPFISVYQGFSELEIENIYVQLQNFFGDELGIDAEAEHYRRKYHTKCDEMRNQFSGCRVAVGSTLNARPFELARFLAEIGFDVQYVLSSVAPPFDHVHIEWLSKNSPNTEVLPNLNPELAFLSDSMAEVDYVFGVDALNFFKTKYLVEIPLDLQLYGYGGAIELMNRIQDAELFVGTVAQKVYSANLVV